MSAPANFEEAMRQAVQSAGDTEAMPPPVTRPVRRPLATCDPDVVAVYERLVIAMEGAHGFAQVCVLDGEIEWLAAAAKVQDDLERAQRRLEALR